MGSFNDKLKRRKTELIKKAREKRGEVLQKYIKEKENNIYEIIKYESLHDGINHGKLAKQIGLDRKSLRKYTNSLLKHNKIKRKTSKDPYFPTTNPFDDPLFVIDIFTEKISFQLFRDFQFSKIFYEGNCKIMLKKNFLVESQYDLTKYRNLLEYNKFAEESLLEKFIFELSNRIGAFILYVLFHAIYPNENLKLKDNSNSKVINEFLNIAIKKLFEHFLLSFLDMIEMTIYNRSVINERNTKNNKGFTIDKKTFDRLIKAFTKIYPILSFEFEEILPERYVFKNELKDIPSIIELLNDEFFKDNLLDKKQNSCMHEFGKVIEEKFNIRKRLCIKCKSPVYDLKE